MTVTFAPATRLGVAVPVPPFATGSGEVRVAPPITVQVLAEVHPYRLLPAEAVLLKNSWPTEQVEGSEVPTLTAEPTPLIVWFGQLPVIVMLEPATRPGDEVPLPPFATDNGRVRLLPIKFQVLVAVQAERLLPATAALLKNNCPTLHVDGSEVPTLTGRVNGMAEKSGFFAWVPRFTVVLVCAFSTGANQQEAKQGSRKSQVRIAENPRRDEIEKNCVFIKRAAFDIDALYIRAVVLLSAQMGPWRRREPVLVWGWQEEWGKQEVYENVVFSQRYGGSVNFFQKL